MNSTSIESQKGSRGLRIGGMGGPAKRCTCPEANFFQKLQCGDTAIIGRAMTLVTSSGPRGQPLKRELLALCRSAPNHAQRIAITGGMGSGKSRILERLGLHLIDVEGKHPCLLTLDSSSSRSGGCILGHKAGMRELMQRPQAFIRPLAAGTSAAKCTAMLDDAMALCAATPFDTILLEVGDASPARSSLISLSDCLLTVIPAGSEGDLAAMRCASGHDADIHIITWPAGTRRDKALITMRALTETLTLFHGDGPHEKPLVVSFTEGDEEAARELWQLIDHFCNVKKQNGQWQARRAAARHHLLQVHICARFEDDFFGNERCKSAFLAASEHLALAPAELDQCVEQLLTLYHTDKTDVGPDK